MHNTQLRGFRVVFLLKQKPEICDKMIKTKQFGENRLCVFCNSSLGDIAAISVSFLETDFQVILMSL